MRRALLTLLIAALVAAACTNSGAGGPASPSASASTSASPPARTGGGPRPEAVDASAFPTRWPIKHVIFLIKENRTFDNLFGTFPGANGASTGMDHGVERPLIKGTDGRTYDDIPHCYECALAAWDGGLMDGFNQSESADRWSYTQLHHNQLPNYWHWA